MIKNKEFILSEVKDYVFITLGLLLYSTAFTIFLMPYEIVTGGVTGMSAFIVNRSPEDFGLPIHDENHLCHLCPILYVNVCTKSNAFGC